ncbi:MAG TPA: PEP-CTERM sorting domain-containing protein [Deltaproteobacteria bacterium]|nr:PEP-CTERM sorting domain-containing protein [Deltaproteobacteria bacterium]
MRFRVGNACCARGRLFSPGSFLLLLLGFVASLGLAPTRAKAGPAVDLHDLHWFVHVDLVDPGAGRDLAYWQGVIDAAVASGNGLLEGGQGPFDQPCCTRLGRSVAVSTFGTPGDGFDMIDSSAKQNAMSGFGGPGSNAFLVDSITWCGGSAPGAIGCAIRPGCDANGNDDPDLWMAVTVDSFNQGTLASVIVHERGHNACLGHVSTAECQIMQGTVFTPGLAGCLDASECSNYQAARTTTASGLECSCHDNAGGGALLADGTICPEGVDGICSGGLCGSFSGDAGVHLIAAADPASALGGPPEFAVQISALKGEWTTLAQFSPAAEDVRGMAFATDSETLFGVVPTVGDDSIVTIDPVAGTILSVVGTIANGTREIVSMAYDPGASPDPADDRLLVLEVGGAFGEVRSIDPATPSSTTLLGSIVWSSPEAFTGLAYDSLHGKLFAATPFGPDGLYEIDLSTCPPSPCSSAQVPGAGLFREDASLAWSPVSGMLYLAGTAFGGQRSFYNVIDPVTGTSVETLSLDVFTPAGLAAVPEPGIGAGLGLGILWLGGAARRRSRRSFPEPA